MTFPFLSGVESRGAEVKPAEALSQACGCVPAEACCFSEKYRKIRLPGTAEKHTLKKNLKGGHAARNLGGAA